MTDAEAAALLALGTPPRGTSAAGNINLYQDIMSMVGNPIFLYEQGLVDENTLTALVRQATREPIELADSDYVSLEDNANARQDTVAVQAYNLIKGGATVAQVLREIAGEGASSAGKISQQLDYDLRKLEEDLVIFKDRWDAAQKLESGIASGEYSVIGDQVFAPMATDKAVAALKGLGLPAFLQNPALWEVVPDAKLMAEAAVGEQRAAGLAQELDKLITKDGVLRSPADRRAVNEAVSKAGTDVYTSFLSRTPEGRSFLEQMKQKPVRESKTNIGAVAKDVLLGQIPVVGQAYLLGKGAVKGVTGAVKSVADSWGEGAPGSRDEQGNFVRPWDRKPAAQIAREEKKVTEAEKRKAQEQDMWAKMAGSYAARAAYEEARKPVTSLEQRVKEAEKRVEEQKAAAMAAGRPLALDIIPQAIATASMLAQPAPKPRYVKPKPRVLSDQEITMMATMLSGGNA